MDERSTSSGEVDCAVQTGSVFLNNETYRDEEVNPTTLLPPTKLATETTPSSERGLLYLPYIVCRGQQTGRYEYH